METIISAVISAVGVIVAAVITTRASRISHSSPQSSGVSDRPPQTSVDVEVASAAGRRWSAWAIVPILLVPGLGSLLIRGWKARKGPFLSLFLTIPIAFVVFGPLWGEVLFKSSDRATREFGLWPFLATCAVVLAISAALTFYDQKVVRNNDA
jgi:hypothetical protein